MATEHSPLTAPPHPSLLQVLRRPGDVDQRNHRRIVLDALPVGFVEGILTYLPVFLVRLGASNLLLGLVTSLPAFVAMLLAVPAGHFLARQRDMVRLTSTARGILYLSYALIGLVPFVAGRGSAELIVAVWGLAALPQVLVSVGITAIVGTAAGPRGRFMLLGRRWSVVGLATTGTILVAGQALRLLPFPLNYQVMFLLVALGAAGTYTLTRGIRLPGPASPAPQPLGLRSMLRQYAIGLRGNRAFVDLIGGQTVLRLGMSMALPLFPIYWIRNLGASDAAVGRINGAATLAAIAGYFVWTRLSQRHGARWVLLCSCVGVSVYPLLTALTHRVDVLAVWAVVAGFFLGGQDLALLDLIFAASPQEEQTVYLGFFTATNQLANTVAPLIGTALSVSLGIVPALVISSALRVAGLVLLAVLRVGSHGNEGKL